jgi:two-component system OmpR family sensor kinase
MRAPGRTLMSRIVWTTTIVSAIAMSAMIGTVLLVLAALTDNNIDARLNDQVSAIAATVRVEADGTVTALETPSDRIDDTTWVYRADGSLVEGPRTSKSVTAVAASLADVRTKKEVTRDERTFLAAPVTRNGAVRAVVVVAASREPYKDTRNAVLLGLVGLGLTVTAGSAAVAAWTVRRTLAPVQSMASRAEDWSEHDLDARFDATGTDDEFAQLGHTLNVLLDRVAGALRTEQQLTSELAHELRTPLTAIRGEAELSLMADLPAAAADRQRRVIDIVDRMSQTITSLLALARGDHRGDARTTSADVVALALDHGPSADGIVIDSAGVTHDEIPTPRDLAARALAPVFENAVTHAAGRVEISSRVTDRAVEIHVSDDGPGITTDDPEALFESGRRSADSMGAGLGLTLSRRVARSLGGEVRIASLSSPTTFVVSFPRF